MSRHGIVFALGRKFFNSTTHFINDRLSRELSRLSRTDKDGCQLIELCQVFNTLIADAQNLYDLNRFDDQLVLGIKGALSVVELKTLKFRLQQGREQKAKRGELGRCLSPGYVTDPLDQIIKDPNLRVQETMALVFKKFHELSSIRQTHRWFHEQRIELPVNKPLGGQFQLPWKLPSLSFVGDVLHNPLIDGAAVLWAVWPKVAYSLLGQERHGSPLCEHR